VFQGHLYSVRTQLIERWGRTLGTLSLGLPIEDADLEEIGSTVGVEVCFVVDGACVAGSSIARGQLSALLVSRPGRRSPEQVEVGGSSWSVSAEPLSASDPSQGWRVTAVPLDGVMAPFHRITQALLLGGGAALAMALLISLVLSRSLSRPVRDLVKATERVSRGDFEAEVSFESRDELGTLATAFNDMTRGLRLKERYRSVLDKVVSREVAEELVEGSVELGGENRKVTVLFADIRGFTTLTDGMQPQEVIGLLNECMERLSEAVEVEGGIVDKYVGDEIMAVFGAPVSYGDDARRAVRAAVRMRGAMEALNAERTARGDRDLALGVGLNSGLAVAGNMGSTNRLNYTVLGDMVNLASRLCSGAGPGEILATRATLSEAGGDVAAHPLGQRAFKGFATDVEVFAVEAMDMEVEGAP
jgi:adenylate cyclase